MKMTRFDFLKSCGAFAALGVSGCETFCGPARPRIALQLFSINKIFWKNPEANLAALAAAGFEGVEFCDFGGKSAKEIRKMLADAGLAGAGVHVNGDIALVGDELKKTLDFCAEAGLESVTTPHASRKTADEYRAFGHQMGLAAEQAEAYGLFVGIHSTYGHFTTKFDGVSAWDCIFQNASSKLQQQIDLGNTFHTGEDVVALLKKYRGRHHSLHAKENDPTENAIFLEPVKDGKNVPWREVMDFAKTDSSIKWWIIEAERKRDTLEPSKKCCEILKGMI